jgi:hypothetical protein
MTSKSQISYPRDLSWRTRLVFAFLGSNILKAVQYMLNIVSKLMMDETPTTIRMDLCSSL